MKKFYEIIGIYVCFFDRGPRVQKERSEIERLAEVHECDTDDMRCLDVEVETAEV